jgi:cell division protein FtsB
VKGEWVRAVGLGTLIVAALAMTAMLDRDSGVGIWLELRDDLAGASARVDVLVAQNDSLQREIELLEADPTAIDRAIREEMDLALPGEVVVRFVPDESPALTTGEDGP